ncbi:MAG: hypothetical protein ACI85O_002457, partial [Saprospiraceae bacterium]
EIISPPSWRVYNFLQFSLKRRIIVDTLTDFKWKMKEI